MIGHLSEPGWYSIQPVVQQHEDSERTEFSLPGVAGPQDAPATHPHKRSDFSRILDSLFLLLSMSLSHQPTLRRANLAELWGFWCGMLEADPFFFLFLHLWPPCRICSSQARGSDPSHSFNLCHSWGNTRSLTHSPGPGIEVRSQHSEIPAILEFLSWCSG